MIFYPPLSIPGIFTRFLLLTSTALGFGGINSSSLIKMYFNRTDWEKYGKNRAIYLRRSFDKTNIYQCKFDHANLCYYYSFIMCLC